jgi:hypothetical protein
VRNPCARTRNPLAGKASVRVMRTGEHGHSSLHTARRWPPTATNRLRPARCCQVIGKFGPDGNPLVHIGLMNMAKE